MLTDTVFDLDETLADSAATWNHVIAAVSTRHGYAWTRGDWTSIQGTSTSHWGKYLAHRCPDLTPDSAVAECVSGMVAAIEHGDFGLLPGAADLVATAAELGRVGLVSASPRRYVDAAVTAFGLGPHLRTTVTGDDVTHGKPAPDPYLLAAHHLGTPPVQCLAVEDSASGIRSAHAAGMTVLAIPNATTALDFDVLALADHQATDAHIAAKTLLALVGPVPRVARNDQLGVVESVTRGGGGRDSRECGVRPETGAGSGDDREPDSHRAGFPVAPE